MVEHLFNGIQKVIYVMVYKVFKVNLSQKGFDFLSEVIRFGLVGVTNTVIGYVAYVLPLWCFKKLNVFIDMDYYLAQLISFIISVQWAFFWSNKVVFIEKNGKKRNILRALLKTYATYACSGLVLEELLLVLWIRALNIDEFIAPILSLCITIPFNFILQKFWSFRD